MSHLNKVSQKKNYLVSGMVTKQTYTFNSIEFNIIFSRRESRTIRFNERFVFFFIATTVVSRDEELQFSIRYDQ